MKAADGASDLYNDLLASSYSWMPLLQTVIQVLDKQGVLATLKVQRCLDSATYTLIMRSSMVQSPKSKSPKSEQHAGSAASLCFCGCGRP